jgi:hypothetical protein
MKDAVWKTYCKGHGWEAEPNEEGKCQEQGCPKQARYKGYCSPHAWDRYPDASTPQGQPSTLPEVPDERNGIGAATMVAVFKDMGKTRVETMDRVSKALAPFEEDLKKEERERLDRRVAQQTQEAADLREALIRDAVLEVSRWFDDVDKEYLRDVANAIYDKESTVDGDMLADFLTNHRELPCAFDIMD